MEELLAIIQPIFSAFGDGQYAYATVLSIVALTTVTKTYLQPRFSWLQKDYGNTLLVLVSATALAMVSPLSTGVAFSLDLLWSAVKAGAAAAGGFKMVKELFVKPFLLPLRNKAPAWLKPILSLVIWFFENNAVEKAEKAGEEAVAKNPSTGTEGVIGSPDENP